MYKFVKVWGSEINPVYQLKEGVAQSGVDAQDCIWIYGKWGEFIKSK